MRTRSVTRYDALMSSVLREELAVIREGGPSHQPRNGSPLPFAADSDLDDASAANLCGLALSGGGIRSATFNLGVLQALAELKLLSRVDYLSTVSGGGYIGAWLTALVHRTPGGIEAVEDRLAKSVHEPDKAVHFLREHSNYLTPRTGFFGADTWSAISIYARNLTLNLTILVSVLVVALLAPLLLLPGFERAANADAPSFLVRAASLVSAEHWIEQSGLADWLAFLCFVPAVVLSGFNLRYLHDCGRGPTRRRRVSSQSTVLLGIVAPAMLGAFFIAASTWDSRGVDSDTPWRVFLAVSGWWISLWLVLMACWHLQRESPPPGTAGRRPHRLVLLINAVLSAAASGLLAGVLVGVIDHADLGMTDAATWLTFGPPLAIAIVSLSTVLSLGLMGRHVSEEVREWWARVGGWMLIVALAWIGLFLVSFFGGWLVESATDRVKFSAAIAWLATTGFGLFAGRSASPQAGQPKKNRALELAATVAPYAFLVGLLLLVSWLTVAALSALLEPATGSGELTIVFPCDSSKWCEVRWWSVLGACGGAMLVALLLSWRVDINAFSLQPLYRNRLVRCYLGASHDPRTPQPFTGFDPGDDIGLATLARRIGPLRPYPLINVALNLVKGEDLAWQERKAAAFTLAPLHCGFNKTYRRTSRYAGGELTLGEAFATSGAAASPNMGYHSNPALAFLMTIFNVRLGRWIGNPKNPDKWEHAGPRFGLAALLNELFGNTNEEAKFIYLSDGGHFDNLGLYELLRRRCRFIIVCDASADPQVHFDDLGSAIRKCRTDFGIDVDLDTSSLRIDPHVGRSRAYCAVAHLRYGDGSTGTVLYLKASLTGSEAVDVLNYASGDATFPHQSTADQWFNESQFESYRRLGYHCGRTVFETAAARLQDGGRLETVFTHLRERWYPSAGMADGTFARHAARLDALTERLRSNPNLSFLDAQIVPTWKDLMHKPGKPPSEDASWLPDDPEARRGGFYFCSSLLQLMESVYVDQMLETQYDHPDNRGWMNLFNHWAWCNMLRVTWALSASTYGARFQSFCRDRLHLTIGEIKVEAATLDKLNFVERPLAEELIAHGQLHAIKLRVSNPEALATNGKSATNGAGTGIDFSVGFALVEKQELRYLRIQDQLRKMGLGRQALKVLVKGGVRTISDAEPPKSPFEASAGGRSLRRLFDSVLLESGNGNAASHGPSSC